MWSPDGPVAAPPRGGWIGSRVPEMPAPRRGWMPVSARRGIDSGLGIDHATTVPALVGVGSTVGADSLYMGVDPCHDFELRVPARDSGIGADLAGLTIDATGVDAAIGDDLARLNLVGIDSAFGDDHAVLHTHAPARDSGIGIDRATAWARQTVRDTAVGADTGIGGFSPRAAASTTISATGSYTIPVWSRYLEVILLGGGGAGGGHSIFNINGGAGGNGGTFYAVRLERGVHIPWTLVSFTVTIGAGGTGASGSRGGDGGTTTTTINGVTHTAPGGSGGAANSLFNSAGPGGTPTPLTWDGITYTPGTGGTANSNQGGDGVAPGAGGGGAGPGVIIGANRGGHGSIGRAWIKAHQ